jgi:Xaa-Pro aminopeptidase
MNPPLIYEPWFERAEYEARLSRVQTELKIRGLDGFLAFQPETVTWLTGFFTRGVAVHCVTNYVCQSILTSCQQRR